MKTNNQFYYNGFGNTFFLNYLHNDFLENTPTSGQSGFFYAQDSYLNGSLNILETDTTIKYDINDYGFRCDNFSDVENNFLFAGCSETFGFGLPNEYRWSYVLNSYLGKNKFHDLSVPAASVYMIVNNIINYLKNIGKPAGIFIMFPDISRMINFMSYKDKLYAKTNFVLKEFDDKINPYSMTPKNIAINSIIALEFVCEILNIDLIWSTWDVDFNKEILDNELNINIFKKYINVIDNMDYSSIDPESFSLYGECARDGHHLGGQAHMLFAKIFYKEYKRLISEK